MPATDIHEQLTKYLADAHSIEEQALAQLRTAPDHAGDEQIAAAFREHTTETENHERTVRSLLEGRDAEPSTIKDTIMKLGGKGFVLFARVQPDTPGKLLAHALSYEALELASYELLARTAERAGEQQVVEAAERIATDEERMMNRLEAQFDRGVDASLRAAGGDDLPEQLRKYLADAHAVESQAEAFLKRGSSLGKDTPLAALFDKHLRETQGHAEKIERRLEALGGDPSTLKDTLMRVGALNWAEFFHGHPDTVGKLAAFAFAFEHLEIGGYEQLKRIAECAGDRDTAKTANSILAEERAAADALRASFDHAVESAIQAQGVRT